MATRLWRLGRVAWTDGPREVYLARGLVWPDAAAAVVAELPCEARPIVLAGLLTPDPSLWPRPGPAVVRLATVLGSVADPSGRTSLTLDVPLAARLIAGADEAAARACAADDARTKRRVDRLVERRLNDGGSTDLLVGLSNMGLSSRQTEEQMKRRGVPMDHATVARKKKTLVDVLKPPPKSSPSVVRHRSSQPRDTGGRAMPNAQPEPDT